MTLPCLYLHVRFLSPWLCGTGRGEGLLHDAIAVRDADGLPYVPGRHLRGLLRDAVSRTPSWTTTNGEVVSTTRIVDLLFGAGPERNARGLMPEGNYFGGLLRISDARLPSDVRDFCLTRNDVDRELVLYSSIHATAMDRATGTAKDKSLRIIQAANPISLIAEVEADQATASSYHEERQGALVAKSWDNLIERALPLVRAMGSSRTRGFGRCIISRMEVER